MWPEWNEWEWKSLSHVRLFEIPWTIQSMEFSSPEYWSGQPFPSPGDLPNPGIEPRSPPLQADSMPAEPQGKPKNTRIGSLSFLQRTFLTQESNQGLLHCRQVLYQLSYQFSSVTQSCLTLCNPMDCSTPGPPVHRQLLKFTQTHVLWVGDAIQPPHPLSSPSPPAFNLSRHQGLFKWISSSHEVAKVLEFQLQHQSFQWTPGTDLLSDELVGSPCSPRDSHSLLQHHSSKQVSCLTTSNLPWFVDLTFQVPMQYYSLQHRTLPPSPGTSTTGGCFCFGSVSSFFLELFLH